MADPPNAPVTTGDVIGVSDTATQPRRKLTEVPSFEEVGEAGHTPCLNTKKILHSSDVGKRIAEAPRPSA